MGAEFTRLCTVCIQITKELLIQPPTYITFIATAHQHSVGKRNITPIKIFFTCSHIDQITNLVGYSEEAAGVLFQ